MRPPRDGSDVPGGQGVATRLASETWLAEARRIARVGSWAWHPARNLFVFSEQMCAILGLEPTDTTRTAESLSTLLHPDDVEPTRAALTQAVTGGTPLVHDCRFVRPDGRVRMVHSRGQMIESEQPAQTRLVGTSWDITEHWETASWPERSVSLLRATLEASADGLLVVDRTNHVVTYNRRFLDIWCIPPDVAERTDNQGLIEYVMRQLEDPELFVRTARENQEHPDEDYFLRLRFKDGRVVERFSRPQRVGTEIIGRVLTFRDVTERESLLEQAQHAVRLRDEFLSIAAHEIRSPITSMRLAVQGLRRSEPTAATLHQSLQVIERSQRRLAEFVDKLLDLARLRTGRLNLDLEAVDLVVLAREVVGRYQSEASHTLPVISIEADDGPVVGRWDRVRLDQVLHNLLANAVKFGAGKPIEVRVTDRGDRAELRVRDQGIGIPVEVQARIFGPFERGVSVEHYGGLGLGLHIVSMIVQALRGTVRVESEAGHGATFIVELPKQATG